ncbi:hypothetical protein Patl1_21508 [Pistacia atlantica]|uniref:Uncharacterized protein n=1 Tax=Pistacia atlantica TaxID=434234 RepID=A0ACC1BKI8_9ROSI|nr:hypothetical protein Patl1_21508 [Pistacia atlantica]
MDSRRGSRAVIDPKVRQVGFFTAPSPPDPIRSSSSSPPQTIADISPSGNSLSPVMIPPPRHPSDTLITRRPPSSLSGDSDFFPPPSPTIAPSQVDFSDDVAASPTARVSGRGGSGKLHGASSLPGGGLEMAGAYKVASSVPASGLTTVSVVNLPPGISETSGGAVSVEVQNERASSKPLKEKTSKAERRALQEAQRAAKAAAKAEGGKTSGMGGPANAKPAKATKPASQKKDNAGAALPSEKKGSDRPMEKERKKDVPHPRMQYDDKSRVEKAKRRSVVKLTEARNRVELFRHLPQYEHGTQLPDLESKFFQLDTVHPTVYKVLTLRNAYWVV